MKIIKNLFLILLFGIVGLVVVLNIWGAMTLGTIDPDPNAFRDP